MASKKVASKQLASIDARLFSIVSDFISTEETRYYLNGVRVEKHPTGGILLCATDGHRMLVAHDLNGYCSKDCIVRLDRSGLKVIDGKEQKDQELVLKVGAAGLAEVHAKSGAMPYRQDKEVLIDGTYPDWKACVAKARSFGAHLTASVQERYLRDFAKVARALAPPDKQTCPMRFIGGASASDPIIVLFPDNFAVFGLLMPMRTIDHVGVPEFMKVALRPKPAAVRKSPRRKKR